MTAILDPEEVAHLLGLDGEIVGVEWDSGAHKVRVVTRENGRRASLSPLSAEQVGAEMAAMKRWIADQSPAARKSVTLPYRKRRLARLLGKFRKDASRG